MNASINKYRVNQSECMERFDYDNYTDKRREILSNFDEFCDELEDRALSSFGKVNDEQGTIGDGFITDAASYRKTREGSRGSKETAFNVSATVFDELSDDS